MVLLAAISNLAALILYVTMLGFSASAKGLILAKFNQYQHAESAVMVISLNTRLSGRVIVCAAFRRQKLYLPSCILTWLN